MPRRSHGFTYHPYAGNSQISLHCRLIYLTTYLTSNSTCLKPNSCLPHYSTLLIVQAENIGGILELFLAQPTSSPSANPFSNFLSADPALTTPHQFAATTLVSSTASHLRTGFLHHLLPRNWSPSPPLASKLVSLLLTPPLHSLSILNPAPRVIF